MFVRLVITKEWYLHKSRNLLLRILLNKEANNCAHSMSAAFQRWYNLHLTATVETRNKVTFSSTHTPYQHTRTTQQFWHHVEIHTTLVLHHLSQVGVDGICVHGGKSDHGISPAVPPPFALPNGEKLLDASKYASVELMGGCRAHAQGKNERYAQKFLVARPERPLPRLFQQIAHAARLCRVVPL